MIFPRRRPPLAFTRIEPLAVIALRIGLLSFNLTANY
jgi:hypothetical protein